MSGISSTDFRLVSSRALFKSFFLLSDLAASTPSKEVDILNPDLESNFLIPSGNSEDGFAECFA